MMDRAEAIKRLDWLAMVGKCVDSVTISGDDWEPYNMAITALREQEQREQITKTNADRIRAMTDEELAEFLEGDYGNMMVGTALKWLKEPAGGADHE